MPPISASTGRKDENHKSNAMLSNRQHGIFHKCFYWAVPAGLLYSAGRHRVASSVSLMSSSSSHPSIAAPRQISSREHPAAKFLSLNFFFTLVRRSSHTIIVTERRTYKPLVNIFIAHFVKVLEPEHIRKTIVRRIGQTLKIYEN